MPAAENAAKSSARVADRPPSSNSTAAFSAMATVDSSSPSSRCRVRSDCSVRPAVSSSIQPMSSAATTCSVPRIGQDRMMSPRSKASCTSWIVDPGTRSPTDHFAPGRSWPCMASIQRTAAAGLTMVLPSTRWAANRRRARLCAVITWTWWQTCRETPAENTVPKTRCRKPGAENTTAARRGRHRAAGVDDPRTVRLSARGRSRRLKGWSPGHVTGDRRWV